MEVELDLWSSRSNDPVEHILSDVDCCDVPDVDEFILGCSSSSELTKNDLTSSVDMHLSQSHSQQQHHQQPTLSSHHHSLLLDDSSQALGQHHQSVVVPDEDCCDDLSSQHGSLASLVDHLGESQQPMLAQHQQQQHHLMGSQPMQRQYQSIQLMPMSQSQLAQRVQYQHQPGELSSSSTSPEHQQQQKQQPRQLFQHHQLVTGQQATSEPQSSALVSTSASNLYSANQQQQQHQSSVNNERNLINESLVASRVDHCYILSEGANCNSHQMLNSSTLTTDNDDHQKPAHIFVNQILANVSSNASRVSSSRQVQLAGSGQQLLHQSPQMGPPVDESMLLGCQTSDNKPVATNKRRQKTATANKRTKSNAQSAADSAKQQSQNCSRAKQPAKSQAVSSSSKSTLEGEAVGDLAAVKCNRGAPRTANARRSNNNNNNSNRQQVNLCKLSAEAHSGQISPTLSSSGVSSLSYSSSASNSSIESQQLSPDNNNNNNEQSDEKCTINSTALKAVSTSSSTCGLSRTGRSNKRSKQASSATQISSSSFSSSSSSSSSPVTLELKLEDQKPKSLSSSSSSVELNKGESKCKRVSTRSNLLASSSSSP